MADEIAINGIGREAAHDETRIVELSRKVKSLELEKAELARGNDEAKQRNHELLNEVKRLKGEGEAMRAKIEDMRMEIELVDEGRRAMDSIMKRAVDLETEVSRLQHDLVSALHEVEEVNRDAANLRGILAEKEKKAGELEFEVEAMKKGKAESENRERELERKVGDLAAKESEWKSEKARSETELQGRLKEKEGLLSEYKKKVETLEAELGKSKAELEQVRKDKSVVGDSLKESEEKVKKLEREMMELQRDLSAAECVVMGMKEKARDAVGGKCLVGMKEHWHLVAAGSAGAVAVAAVMAHVYFSKRRS
ncbi:hypothetical protein MLD38_009220 [Melastoma candidum]|uniref:Uncharacterized protein n=1 Tax=Melastoma candidum TaxID=119954 RepID=A0ACB9RXE5_9MYRT|nr:hypothetical protein MLD38_009220 [Melastoma candidum]